MQVHKKLSQECKARGLVKPQNIATAGTVNTDASGYISMQQDLVAMILIEATMPASSTVVAQATCSSAAAATNKKDITGKTATLTSTGAGSHIKGVIDVKAEDIVNIDSTNGYIGVDLTSDVNDTVVAAQVILVNCGFNTGSTMNS